MRLETAGRTIAVPRGHAQRLLGYLACHGPEGQRRETLADALWPAAPGRSLTDTLYRVRASLGDVVAVDPDTVALDPDLAVDIHDFDVAAVGEELVDLERAIALYDELLPGVYDDWALVHRAARSAALVAALHRVVTSREQAGDLEGAVSAARQLIAAEPLDESGHEAYLRLLGRLGRHAAAAAHFETLTALLADELGVAPSASTAQLAQRLAEERAVASDAELAEPLPFVGRARERSVVVRAVAAACDRSGGIVGVEGVAGIGKSRLLCEALASATWRGAAVGHSEVAAIPEASALAPLARAIAPLLSTPLRTEIESRLDTGLLRSLGAFYHGWVGDDRSQRVGVGDDAPIGPALRVVGEALARAGPVVVVIDDVHWATASTWDHIAAFADGFVRAGGLLVLGYRRPEIESMAGWPVLQEWDQRRWLSVVTLGPLALDELGELVGADIADARDPADVLAVTGGVPFYVMQFMEAADGRLAGDGTSVIDGRLDRLGGEARGALECAAVLGDSPSFRAWTEVVGKAPLELAAIGDRLVADRWLTPTSDGYEFVHDLLRERVYDAIDEPHRCELHARAADALAAVEPGNQRARAYHLDRAGRFQHAAAAYRAAGDSFFAEVALHDARAAWERALELLPAGERDARLRIGLQLGSICDAMGWRPQDREVVAEAVKLAVQLGDDKALLRGLLLQAGDAVGRAAPDAAAEEIAEARALATRLGDVRGVAQATFRHADLLTQHGRWREADEHFSALLDLLDRDADPLFYGRAVRGAAICAARRGRPTEAAARLHEAIETFRVSGDRLEEMHASGAMLLVSYELAQWDQFVESAAQVLPLARQLGDPITAGIAANALSLGALAVGDHVTARAMILEAESQWASVGRKRMVAGAINALGLVAEAEGEHAEAIDLYTRTIDAARELGSTTHEAYASHDLGALLHELGRPSEAVGLLRMAAAHWAEVGNDLLRAKSEAYLGLALLAGGRRSRAEVSDLADAGLQLYRSGEITGEHPQGWLWALSRLLHALGRDTEAGELLDAAHRELLQQASSIADPERRRGFFERVPLNRAIVAAVDTRSGVVRVATVRLAAADAPLGRTLRPDEYVDVRWTLDAADDAAIPDAAARRRHRLTRLLGEAAEQGAAPTDGDLAAALGVSRRTVLRDFAVLGDRATAPTRRRSAALARTPVRAGTPVQ